MPESGLSSYGPSSSSCCSSAEAQSTSVPYELNDSHFHLTNDIQQGTDIHDFLNIMDTKVGRVALFGIPLQQQWSYQNSGDFAPTYYLQSDAPLYYYSFTDAYIAMAYRSLTPAQQTRFDPRSRASTQRICMPRITLSVCSRRFRACLPVSANLPFTRNLSPRKSQEKLPVLRIQPSIDSSILPWKSGS